MSNNVIIFEEINNDLDNIKDQEIDLNKIINEYAELNYTVIETLNRIKGIKKFGLSDEIRYFVNNNNELVDNTDISEEDIYNEDKVILALENILRTILNGILKLIKKSIEIIKNIIKYIVNIIKNFFKYFSNIKSDIEDTRNNINKIDKETALKKLYDKISTEYFQVNHYMYLNFLSDKEDLLNLSQKINTLINKFGIAFKEFDEELTDAKNDDRAGIYVDIKNGSYYTFTELFEVIKITENNPIFNSDITIKYLIEDIFKTFNDIFSEDIDVKKYYNEESLTLVNRHRPDEPFKFPKYTVSNKFKQILKNNILPKYSINLISNEILNVDDISNLKSKLIELLDTIEKMISVFDRIINIDNKAIKEYSLYYKGVISNIEDLFKHLNKIKNTDDIDIEVLKYSNLFFNAVINTFNSYNTFGINDLATKSNLVFIFSNIRSLDKIIMGIKKYTNKIKDIEK